MPNDIEQRRKALFARTPDRTLVDSLRTLAATPPAEVTAETRLVHAWTIDEIERRFPAAAEAVGAAFEAAEATGADVDYVAVLLANIPA